MNIFQFEKAELTDILLNHYQEKKNFLVLKEYALQQKHACFFDDFEQQVNNSEEEDFEKWDDYIEWKAFHKSMQHINELINIIKSGNFAVA